MTQRVTGAKWIARDRCGRILATSPSLAAEAPRANEHPLELSDRPSLWQIVHSDQLRRIDHAVLAKELGKREVNLDGVPIEVTPLWNGPQIVGTLVVVCDGLSPASEGPLTGATVYMVTLRNQDRRRDTLAIFTSEATAQGYATTYNRCNHQRHLAVVEPHIAIVQSDVEPEDFTVD